MQFKVLFMDTKNYQEDLSHIRSIMEKSSRFISLSGLSGVFVGIFAVLGAVYVFFAFEREGIGYFDRYPKFYDFNFISELILVAFVVLVFSLAAAVFFTVRKSKRKELPIWATSTKLLIINFSIPLVTGGIFCLGLIFHHFYAFLAPCTLIFYGLSLINASKYTYSDIRYLGVCEVILGLLSSFLLGYGLVFWALGFGVLHIIYGLILYKKYQ